VKVLLDENFPLGLVRILQADGLEVEHIITLGLRGTSDARIRERLTDRELVFLTQDDDFLSGETVSAVKRRWSLISSSLFSIKHSRSSGDGSKCLSRTRSGICT
jgi:predicted nuclease of predicted toxin-antitoxin system